jgi:hypothetical protein
VSTVVEESLSDSLLLYRATLTSVIAEDSDRQLLKR